MIISNHTGFEKISDAIAHFYKTMPEILDALKTLPPMNRDFSYTEETNFEVVQRVESAFNSNMELFVKPWVPYNPFTRAIGYSDGSEYIYVNVRKINALTAAGWAGNICHEWLHCPPLSYSHGSNYVTTVKRRNVNYALGYLVSGESSYPLVKQKPHIEVRRCYRPWRYLKLIKVCEPIS